MSTISEGLFIRLGHAIDSIGAKRVVLDTIETFSEDLKTRHSTFPVRRLFRWLKDKGVTAIVTGERGDGQLTRRDWRISPIAYCAGPSVSDQINAEIANRKISRNNPRYQWYPSCHRRRNFGTTNYFPESRSHRSERVTSGIRTWTNARWQRLF